MLLRYPTAGGLMLICSLVTYIWHDSDAYPGKNRTSATMYLSLSQEATSTGSVSFLVLFLVFSSFHL